MSRRRLAILALPVTAALAAACFSGDAPTEQVGGTQYGMLLNVVTPVRVPTMQVTATASPAATLTQITARLTNFKPLAAPAAYQFYAVGAGAGDTVPVTATLTRIRNDSTVNAAGAVAVTRTSTALAASSFFQGTENNDTLVAVFAGAQFGGTTRRFLVVTIQADQAAPAYTGATPQPAWFRYRNDASPFNIITTAGNALFGNFDLTQPRPFSGNGRGRSAFWDILRDGHLEYQAIVEQVTQPPRGYFYRGWLRDTRTRRAFAMSDMVDNAGQSLRDADMLPIPGSVAQLAVGRFGITEQDVGQPLSAFDRVHLMLEPKLGVDSTHALAAVLEGVMGDTLGLRGLGAIQVVVQRGSEAVGGVAIVVVPDGASAAVGQPRPATTADAGAAKGTTVIGGIPAGPVQLYITAPAGMSAPATRPTATVVARDTVTVTVTLP
jgi:hypothetical protein